MKSKLQRLAFVAGSLSLLPLTAHAEIDATEAIAVITGATAVVASIGGAALMAVFNLSVDSRS